MEIVIELEKLAKIKEYVISHGISFCPGILPIYTVFANIRKFRISLESTHFF